MFYKCKTINYMYLCSFYTCSTIQTVNKHWWVFIIESADRINFNLFYLAKCDVCLHVMFNTYWSNYSLIYKQKHPIKSISSESFHCRNLPIIAQLTKRYKHLKLLIDITTYLDYPSQLCKSQFDRSVLIAICNFTIYRKWV